MFFAPFASLVVNNLFLNHEEHQVHDAGAKRETAALCDLGPGIRRDERISLCESV
jgi:hypothetical protein